MTERYDYVIIGSGLGGLTIGALLAASGRRVAILERHEVVGGYGHTFKWPSPAGDFHFCAHLHYVWDCGEGGHVHAFLKKIGLAEEVRFRRFDPDGFDRVVLPQADYSIANGFYNNERRLAQRYPGLRRKLARYFRVLAALYDDVSHLPPDPTPWQTLTRFRDLHTVIRYRNWTLQDLFDRLDFPPELQAILAGQAGCYFLPPDQVSLLAHAVVAAGYDAGAYYPERTYRHFVESIANVTADAPGGAVHVEASVRRLEVEGGKVVAAVLEDGRRFEGDRFISNADPALTVELAGREHFDKRFLRKLDFEYSISVFSMYLGLKGVDLPACGIGNHNVWYYPSNDLNALYRRAMRDDEPPDEPFLFITSPTQHTPHTDLLAPPGHQQLVILACTGYEWWRRLRTESAREYRKAKKRFGDSILDVVERRFVPGLRDAIVTRAVGSPTTNEGFVSAVSGNCYGSELTPRNVNFGRLSYRTPLDNLYLVGAASGMPGFAGCVTSANKVYEQLTGDSVWTDASPGAR